MPKEHKTDAFKSSLTIISTNAQGLTNKTQALEILAHTHHADIICVSEHWLNESNADLYNIQNFHKTSCYVRQDHIHGGVCIFTKNTIESSEIEFINKKSIEMDCEMSGIYLRSQEIIIISIYRSPIGNLDNFLEVIEATLIRTTNVHKRNTQIVIVGDFNIYLHTDNVQRQQLLNLMSSHGLLALFQEPTRVTSTSSSCIDNAFMGMMDNKSRIVDPGYGDHKALIIQIPCKQEQHEQLSYKRTYSLQNINKYQQLIKQQDWASVTQEPDANRATNRFLHILMEHHNLAFPITPRQRPKTNIRLTPRIMQARETLRLVRRLNDGKHDTANLNTIKQYEQLYVKMAEEEHRRVNTDRIKQSQDKTRTIWNIINNETRRKRLNNYDASSSEEFSRFYSTMSTNTSTPIVLNNKIQCNNTLFMTPTDPKEILNILQLMKPKRGADIFGLSPCIIKWVAEDIAEPLSTIINTSLTTGTFPDKLKIARITPVYKNKGDKNQCRNYRPIAVLPAVSKIFEEAVMRRLYDHFEKKTTSSMKRNSLTSETSQP